jgi:hypothetical protein
MLAHGVAFVPVVENGRALGYVDTATIRSIDREYWEATRVEDIFVALTPDIARDPARTAGAVARPGVEVGAAQVHRRGRADLRRRGHCERPHRPCERPGRPVHAPSARRNVRARLTRACDCVEASPFLDCGGGRVTDDQATPELDALLRGSRGRHRHRGPGRADPALQRDRAPDVRPRRRGARGPAHVTLLMSEGEAARHDGYMHHHLVTGERRIIGTGREVEGRRVDGTLFPLHLSIGRSETPAGSALRGHRARPDAPPRGAGRWPNTAGGWARSARCRAGWRMISATS